MSRKVIFGIGADFMKRDGLTDEIQPWEDGLRSHPERGEFEWWYSDARFEDGSTAVIVFFTKSLISPRSVFKPGILLTITTPEGERISESVSFAPTDFSASRERCDIHVGGNTHEGDLHTYTLHARTATLSADLTLRGIVSPWRPGTGKNYYDSSLKSYFAWLPALPFAKVAGSLTYHGRTVQVRGEGYHDHNWGNVALNRVLSHWVWGRARVGDFSLIFVEMNATKAYEYQKIPVLLLSYKDKVLIEDPRKMCMTTRGETRHSGKRVYPHEVDFDLQDADILLHLRLRDPQVIESNSLLAFLPAWQQKLVRLFINPYYFRFRATLQMEVNLPGVKSAEKGDCIYELMLLR